MTTELPTGTVTFLLTDVEDSVRLWEEHPDVMPAMLARHYSLTSSCCSRHGGAEVKHRREGDSAFLVFSNAHDGLALATDLLRQLNHDSDMRAAGFKVRIGLHCCDAEPVDGDYTGTGPNLCGRLRDAAHGGQALLSRAVYDLVRDRVPDEAAVVNLGQYQLRGFERSQRVYQVTPSGIPETFPPLRARPSTAVSLPADRTAFIGRRRELAEILQELRHARLLTLTGIGGCGKTRLATEAARASAASFADGVTWVDLSSTDDGTEVCRVIAAALKVRVSENRPVAEAVLAWLRWREILIILDGCEHLAEECATFVDRLLNTCPDVRVLATSRHEFRLRGEQCWVVPPMTMALEEGDGVSTGDRLSDAVSMFVACARLRRPNFAPSLIDLAHIQSICKQIDGIPLSIELAAAKVGHLSLADIADQVTDCFGTVFRDPVFSPSGRSRSLYATMAWSYDRLTEREQAVFSCLSVFRGWFDISAASAVIGDTCDEQSCADVLGDLYGKSMIVVEHGHDGAQYRLLEPLRQFGWGVLEVSDAGAQARLRHLQAMVTLTETAEIERKRKGMRHGHWLKRLDRASDDIRAALQWSAAGHHTDLGLRLVGAARMYWYLTGRTSPARELTGQILAVSSADDASGDRAHALHTAGTLAIAAGDYVGACSVLQQSVGIQRPLGASADTATMMNNLGVAYYESGKFADALMSYRESLDMKRHLADRRAIAVTLGNMATCAAATADFDKATSCAEESISLLEVVGATPIKAWACLARVSLDRGDYPTARAYYERCLRHERDRLDRTRAVAHRLRAMWLVEHLAGRMREARTLIDECMAVTRSLPSRTDHGLAKGSLGSQLASEGDNVVALQELREARELMSSGGRARDSASIAQATGVAHLALNNVGSAADCVCAALKEYHKSGLRLYTLEALEDLARVAHAAGDHLYALSLVACADTSRNQLGTPRHPAVASRLASDITIAERQVGDCAADAARDVGRQMSTDVAVGEVLTRFADSVELKSPVIAL